MLPIYTQHQAIQTTADPKKSHTIPRTQKLAFLRQCRCQRQRYGAHVAEKWICREFLVLGDAQCLENGIAMASPDLVTDDFIHRISRPTQSAEERVPCPQT